MPTIGVRLKWSEVALTRRRMIESQDGRCPLCEREVKSPVMDHDHKTGSVRAVLCRGCNAVLGKIERAMVINRLDWPDLKNLMKNLIWYATERVPEFELIHPSVKTVAEKKLTAKRRAKRRAAEKRRAGAEAG